MPAAAGPRAHALPGGLQDLHHPGNHGQRRGCARLAHPTTGRPRLHRKTLCSPQYQRGKSCGLRHHPGTHLRLLGLGGRTLLRLERHRHAPVHCPRIGAIPILLGRCAPNRPPRRRGPFSPEHPANHGGSWHLVPKFFRRQQPRRFAVRPVPAPLCGLLAAGRHGVQRQIRGPRREPRYLRHRTRGLGRTRHQRPTCFLPIDPPRHGINTVGFHCQRASAAPAARTPRQAPEQFLGTNRGPRPGPAHRPHPLQGIRGQQTHLHLPV